MTAGIVIEPGVGGTRTAVRDEPLLAVDGLTVRYGAGGAPAVDDVTFTVGNGERVALVGESGSGKTTLGLALAGFLTQGSAELVARRMEFEGSPLGRVSRSRLPERTAGLSMVFQDAMTSLDPVWTIGSQLRAVIRSTEKVGRAQLRERSRYWLDRVGLPDPDRVLAARPYELSGGMRQRAMMAIALCGRPRLLIADEPTSALDASLSRDVMAMFVELTEEFGTGLLVISHDILLAQQYTHRTFVMYGGRIVEQRASARLAAEATDPYTIGLLRCVPTLESAGLDELPTLSSVAAELAAGAASAAVPPAPEAGTPAAEPGPTGEPGPAGLSIPSARTGR